MQFDVNIVGDLPFSPEENKEPGIEVLPPSVYDKTGGHPKLEEASAKLFGDDLFEEIEHCAKSSGISPMTYVRQQASFVLMNGSFMPEIKEIAANEKRGKDDEDNAKMGSLQAYVRNPTFNLLSQTAKAYGMGNVAFIRRLMQHIVDEAAKNAPASKHKTKRAFLDDSKAKQKAVEEHIEKEKYKLYGVS